MPAINLHSRDFPAVLRGAFPDYRGPHFKLEAAESVLIDSDSWEGGTKYTYRGVDLATGQSVGCNGEFGNPYTNPSGRIPTVKLEPGKAVVVHKRFCGKDLGLHAYVHPDNLVPMLPAHSGGQLTDDERKALNCVASIKGGQYRVEEWARRGLGKYGPAHPLIESLRAKGLVTVNKAGAVAVTIEGRNANRSN